ncbi:MAG: hypothetical protein AMXMBFR47_32970 [Planctomycetota bacterium]
MGFPHEAEVTLLLSAARAGDAGAVSQLWARIEAQIREIARGLLAHEARRGDMQTTVLCNEAYVRIAAWNGNGLPENRRELFAIVAKVMRHTLVDDARKRNRLKRGGGRLPSELRDDLLAFEYDADRILAVHESLERIKTEDPGLVRLVELRFFFGRSVAETAEILGVSRRQVSKDWSYVKARLYDLLA